MKPSAFGRLVDLYRGRLLTLFKGKLPMLIENPGYVSNKQFQEGIEQVAMEMAKEVAGVNAATWRAAAFKSTNARKINEALQQEIHRYGLQPVLNAIAKHNAEIISSIPLQLSRQITAHAAELQRRGSRPEQIAKEMRSAIPVLSRSKIDLIARTEISRAQTDVTRIRSERIGIRWYQWVTSEDQRVRDSHKNMNLVLVPWAKPPAPEKLIGVKSSLGAYHAGQCPNCFPGETPVSSESGFKTLWRAPYSGDLIEIEIETGVRFLATPNHPILTASGWVAVSELQVGDDVVHLRRCRDAAIKPNMENSVTTFKEVFEAMSAKASHRNRTFGLNFHGDVINDDIDEISIADHLSLDVQAGISESLSYFSLPDSYRWIGNVVAGITLKIIDTILASFSSKLDFFGIGCALHADAVGLGSGASCYPILNQIPLDRFALNTKMSSDALFAPLFENVKTFELDLGNPMTQTADGLFDAESCLDKSSGQMSSGAGVPSAERSKGFSSDKTVSRITKKFVRKSSGHVYTGETSVGWYGVSLAGIIAKNCRCTALPLADLSEVKWPCRVFHGGSIKTMGRMAFAKVAGLQQAA